MYILDPDFNIDPHKTVTQFKSDVNFKNPISKQYTMGK